MPPFRRTRNCRRGNSNGDAVVACIQATQTVLSSPVVPRQPRRSPRARKPVVSYASPPSPPLSRPSSPARPTAPHHVLISSPPPPRVVSLDPASLRLPPTTTPIETMTPLAAAKSSSDALIKPTIPTITPAMNPRRTTVKVVTPGSSTRKDGTPTHHRNENALGILTKRFVELLKQTPSGRIDLNEASNRLGIQKRRIYDVAAVLQGCGMIERQPKSECVLKLDLSSRHDRRVQKLQREADKDKEELVLLNKWTGLLQNKQEAHSSEEKQWLYMMTDHIQKQQQVQTTKDLKPDKVASASGQAQDGVTTKSTTTMTSLAICTPRGSVLHLAPPADDASKKSKDDNEQDGSSSMNNHTFSVSPPETDSMVQAYLWEGAGSPLKPLALTPPPPLFATCCSDFTLDALSSLNIGVTSSTNTKKLDLLEDDDDDDDGYPQQPPLLLQEVPQGIVVGPPPMAPLQQQQTMHPWTVMSAWESD